MYVHVHDVNQPLKVGTTANLSIRESPVSELMKAGPNMSTALLDLVCICTMYACCAREKHADNSRYVHSLLLHHSDIISQAYFSNWERGQFSCCPKYHCIYCT